MSADELADIACALRERVDRPADSRYRLVGVGLSGFIDADSYQAQADLFD
jgi:DNA polymerase-4